jgi:hypothetical protein
VRPIRLFGLCFFLLVAGCETGKTDASPWVDLLGNFRAEPAAGKLRRFVISHDVPPDEQPYVLALVKALESQGYVETDFGHAQIVVTLVHRAVLSPLSMAHVRPIDIELPSNEIPVQLLADLQADHFSPAAAAAKTNSKTVILGTGKVVTSGLHHIGAVVITAYDIGRSSREHQVEAWRAWIDFGYLSETPYSDLDVSRAVIAWARRYFATGAGEIKQTLPAAKLLGGRDALGHARAETGS